MLSSMRQNLKSLQIFLWLVIAAFVGTIFLVWGQGGRQGGAGAQNAAAWVNGEPISFTSFENSYRDVYTRFKQQYEQFGATLTREDLENLQIHQIALNQLTQRELLVQEAEKYDLQVSDQELITAIQSMPEFQTNNQFDPGRYESLLARARLTPKDFEEQMIENLLVQKMQYLIYQTVRVSEQEVFAEYQAQNEKITVEGVLVNAAPFEEQAEVTDEAIQAYYDAHKETFTTPERVKIQYIHYDPEQIATEVTPSEEAIRDYYLDHESEFDKGKEVRARHILFRVAPDADDETVASVKAKAEEVLQKIQEGADFAYMAKEHSEDPVSGEEGGDLGFFPEGTMVPEF
ncbi:hypothetical protein GF339_12855 [candidate division KSB3 bacterium]|uniref:Periplasmic chaperone PpiD n=1 Tax=candidate division KSB3 bacterium TaxID=2044937 RepID=A0A9D5JWL7_9BACT|nr:hypothetical protein [candidate division KSB3 bacterium]MBD3325473.1 hypothetical protein [candidate division KSB3 bacterium]